MNILRDYSGDSRPERPFLFLFGPRINWGEKAAALLKSLFVLGNLVAGGGIEPPTCGL